MFSGNFIQFYHLSLWKKSIENLGDNPSFIGSTQKKNKREIFALFFVFFINFYDILPFYHLILWILRKKFNSSLGPHTGSERELKRTYFRTYNKSMYRDFVNFRVRNRHIFFFLLFIYIFFHYSKNIFHLIILDK